MPRASPTNRRIAWTTLLVLLLTTLAPSIAHAIHFTRGDTMPWSQLCSATGGKRILFEEPANDIGSLASDINDHCAYCALHDHCAALPSNGVEPALRVAVTRSVATPLPAAAPSRSIWRPAQSRAPPQRT